MEIGVSVFLGVAALLAVWTLHAVLFPVEGIWKREDVEEEFVQLDQFGPFVTGKRNVDGGNHIYSGTLTFSRLKLTRRDFGLTHLIAAGFPRVIATKLNGSVMARLRLSRRKDRLDGIFVPQKILFDEPSARVLSREYQAPIERSYIKTTLQTLPLSKATVVPARAANLPPPPQKKKKRGNTF